MATFDDCIEAAKPLAQKLGKDVFFYSGPIDRGDDLKTILGVHGAKAHKECLFIVVTGGGSPDAAYKIARYFQAKYDKFSVLVSGLCKSAGTLIALGAHELVFMPFGELGPLDVQIGKVDKFDSLQSGLTIQEAINTLESRATQAFCQLVSQYIEANGGLLSFASASDAASKFVTQLYAPMFSRIDPEEVGVRSRSMRIAHDYGSRLSVRSQNMKADTLRTLTEKYPSHSFVVDQREAEGLFKHVREATDLEKSLVSALSGYARFPRPRPEVTSVKSIFMPFFALSTRPKAAKEGSSDDKNKRGRRAASDGKDTVRPAKPPRPVAKSKRGSAGPALAHHRANGKSNGNGTGLRR